MATTIFYHGFALMLLAYHCFVCGLDNNRVYDCYSEFCNQHSYSCSQKTTECRNCQDNTYGPFCNLCKDGYYGNATREKHGCKRCPCPLEKSNGSCVENKANNSVKCLQCMLGYHGDVCNQCDVDYYKEAKTGLCKRCKCNGNGNVSLIQKCEPTTGKCYQCFHNSSGLNCEQCVTNFYLQKQENEQSKCVPCNCNGNSVPGMAPICDWKTGVCIACWPNTTGSHCEKCAHGYKGDALNAKNCTAIPIGSGSSSSYTKKVVIALVTSLLVITLGFMVVAVLIWWRKKKSREPLGFVTITMNHVDEDDYNISWIDPVTGDPIHHNEVNTELPNGGLELIDEYEDHVGEFESNDTDRML